MFKRNQLNILFLLLISIIFSFLDKSQLYNLIPYDSYTYIQVGDMLYHKLQPHPDRPIGITFLFGLPNIFIKKVSVKQYVNYNLILNYFFWLSTIFILYKSLTIFFKNKISLILTLFFVFSVGSLANTFVPLSEPVTTFLLIITGYYLFRYLNEGEERNIFYLLTVALLFIQLFSMLRAYGNFTPSYIGSYTLYVYLCGKSKAKEQGTKLRHEVSKRKKEVINLTKKKMMGIASKDFKKQVNYNSANLIKIKYYFIFHNYNYWIYHTYFRYKFLAG